MPSLPNNPASPSPTALLIKLPRGWTMRFPPLSGRWEAPVIAGRGNDPGGRGSDRDDEGAAVILDDTPNTSGC